ncbi:hypothetical protein [Pseudomonas sp. C2B4]|uniref:hypothetical protein n=1 Tax=Pseudomonas sp. C2B4 TaxID=2735270 RepID=UPI0015865AD2|nr:hypothetical protein [Pseudomonas sp. C2B4]NUU37833.1 hypothetical protein [Pseudomonas sp. C2B4]
MNLTKPNLNLRRDLRQAAALLKWSGVDLFTIAQRFIAVGDEVGANELMKIALGFQETEDRLAAYADEVQAKRIVRATIE